MASKTIACETIAQNFEQAKTWKSYLEHCPEYGFFEFETSGYICAELEKMGYRCEKNLAITGVRATKKGHRDGAHICVMGELDAVCNYDHPLASPETGAAHACGHHLQLVQLLSVAKAFATLGDVFEGTVSFFACPSEEFIQLQQRQVLIDQGKLHCMSGKQELLLTGVLDDVDMVIMLHAHPLTPEKRLFTRGSSLGFACKTITFTGKETHGSTPHMGINALNAATLALSGIHANRETFAEEQRIKIHPIITKGGDQLNNVSGLAQIQTYIRGASPEAIVQGCAVVDNCANGAALMIGTQVTIENQIGYMPLQQSQAMSEILEDNAIALLGKDVLVQGVNMVGSSDIGDVSHLIPTLQPTFGGFVGAAHSKEFQSIDDQYHLVEIPQLMVCTLLDLLKQQTSRHIIDTFQPTMTKQAYKYYLQGGTEKYVD